MLGQKNTHKDCIFSGTSILDCYAMANSVPDLDPHDLVHFRSGICIQKKARMRICIKKSKYRSQEFAPVGKIIE
jgi:hypothetical protein